jgi:DNA adenine methylase
MPVSVPHPIPYQGSKRNLAPVIGQLFPRNVHTLYEPFAGSAAFSLFAAKHGLAEHFVIGDSLPQLIELWRQIIAEPHVVAGCYEKVWRGQSHAGPEYFNLIRDRYNQEGNPIDLLYLIARCVKNAVRFNRHGKFTQSVDKRRLGMKPTKMASSLTGASQLLKGRVDFVIGDFTATVEAATSKDLVYMDPPYQGTTYGRDKRYFAQLERGHLIEALEVLNARQVPFLLSYDGTCGSIAYGEAMPPELELQRLMLHAGRSSQATLNGRDDVTVESLYVSKFIPSKTDHLSNGTHADLFAAA